MWLRLATTIARNVAVSHRRTKLARKRHDLGPCGDPDHSPGDLRDYISFSPIEQRLEVLALLEAIDASTGTDAAIVHAVAEDVPHQEIAVELGLERRTG